MALRAGYYGVKRALKDKLAEIAGKWDTTIASLFPRSEQAIVGAVNLLNNTAETVEKYGVTFTVNNDKSISLSGTATADVSILINTHIVLTEGQKFRLSGCPAGGGSDKYYLRIATKASAGDNWGSSGVSDYGDGIDYTVPENTYGLVSQFAISNGVNVTGLVVKPMISLSKYDVYAPNASTNSELTASAADQKTTINAIIAAATGAADFAAFKTAMGAITPVTRSLSMATPEEIVKDEIEEPVVEKKTTTRKKSTAKADTTEEV